MKRQKKIALCALLSAASFVVLFLGSISGVLDMAAAGAAALAVMFCAVEMGLGYGFCTYAVTSFLALFLLPEKTAAWCFALFFGLHILLIPLCERLGKTISFIVRLIIANATLVFYLFVIEKILLVPEEAGIQIVTLITMNIIFVLCNLLYFRLVRLYYVLFRKKIERYLK